MVRQYETTFIVDAHLQGEEIEAAVTKYTQLIEKHGGKIKLIDRWGKRRLVYEIAKKQYGYYVYVRFEAEGTLIEALEKDFRIDDRILRYLVLVVPKAMADAEIAMPEKTVDASEEEPVEAVEAETETESNEAEAS